MQDIGPSYRMVKVGNSKGKIYHVNFRPSFKFGSVQGSLRGVPGSFSWVIFMLILLGEILGWKWVMLNVCGLGLAKAGWMALGLSLIGWWWVWVELGGGGLGLAHLWEAALPPSFGWLWQPRTAGCEEEWPPSEARTQAQLAPLCHPPANPTPPPCCHPSCTARLPGQGVDQGQGQGSASWGPWWGWYVRREEGRCQRLGWPRSSWPSWLWGLMCHSSSPAAAATAAQLMQQTNKPGKGKLDSSVHVQRIQ